MHNAHCTCRLGCLSFSGCSLMNHNQDIGYHEFKLKNYKLLSNIQETWNYIGFWTPKTWNSEICIFLRHPNADSIAFVLLLLSLIFESITMVCWHCLHLMFFLHFHIPCTRCMPDISIANYLLSVSVYLLSTPGSFKFIIKTCFEFFSEKIEYSGFTCSE